MYQHTDTKVPSTSGSTSLGRIIHILTKLAYCIGFVLLALIGLLWFFQERLLFHPNTPQGNETPDKNPEPYQHPGQLGMEYENVTMTAPDGCKLHGWFIKQKDPAECAKAPTLIFFQGNAGNMGFRLPNIYQLQKKCRINVFAVSYRGYGYSSGVPSEQGVYMDANTTLAYLLSRTDIDTNKIVVFGRSMGGAVAIELAYRHPDKIRAVITENTFTSLKDMIIVLFPFFKWFPSLLYLAQRMYMDSIAKVPFITVPILYISGLQDILVPPSHVAMLYSASKSSPERRLFTVATGTHNNTWLAAGREYYIAISDFLTAAFSIMFSVPQSDRKPVGPLTRTLEAPSFRKKIA